VEDKFGGDSMDWMDIDGRVLGREIFDIIEGLTLLLLLVVVTC